MILSYCISHSFGRVENCLQGDGIRGMISLHQLPLLFLTQSSRPCKEGESTVLGVKVTVKKTGSDGAKCIVMA